MSSVGCEEEYSSRTKAAAATFLVLSNDTSSSNSISSFPSVFIAFSTCLSAVQHPIAASLIVFGLDE
jgi:hypothetical protein